MKVVLDTNIIVAGLLSPFGPCGDIVRIVVSGELVLCFDARILSEYSEVLIRPKFQFQKDKVNAILDYMEFSGQTVAALPLAGKLPDPDDEKFLQVAIAGGAKYLVTGNHRHYPPDSCEGVKVISPSEFIEQFKKREK